MKKSCAWIQNISVKVNREDFRKKYGIPDNAFVISYAGRHNEIKGYADLKRLGEKLLADKNVYFLIAGKEEPMTGLKNDHWIEVGWTNDPHSLIAASDVFVLPNHVQLVMPSVRKRLFLWSRTKKALSIRR